MCGRYALKILALQGFEEYSQVAHLDGIRDRYNIAPSQQVPVLRTKGGDTQASMVRWGLIPFFANGEPPKYSTINARIETFETAASYRGPWKRGQRCLQLASGFYEWHLGASGTKQPYYIHLADAEAFAFAAIWDRSVKADGTAVDSCAHITMPANELMRDIHNAGNNPHRMPAILRHEDWQTWLSGSAEEARELLRQYPSGLMVAHPVSTRVNSPKNEGPELIEPHILSGRA